MFRGLQSISVDYKPTVRNPVDESSKLEQDENHVQNGVIRVQWFQGKI